MNKDNILKKCIDCLEKKQIIFFYNRKDSLDGKHNYCKDCHNKRNKISVRKWQNSLKGKKITRLNNEKYRETHKEEIKDYQRVYARKYQSSENGLKQRRIIDKRKRSDPTFRIGSNMSRMLRSSLKRGKEGFSWTEHCGYSLKQLIEHLEKLFTPKMNWNNYGSYWHIDHIIPRSYFKYNDSKDSEFIKCWSLSNLQPLEAIENIKKSNKILWNSK